MKLKLIQIANFNSVVDASMSMDNRGLLLVQGDNQLSTSSDSNGSGKSTLLESILWGLYGKTIRYDLKGGKPTGDLCVNDRFGPDAGKNCRVRQVWDMDGRVVEITRYRKDKTHKNNVYISVDGNDFTRGTSKETDRLIAEMVGLDFPSFVRSVYFDGKSIVPFPTLSDAEIKAVFERVLGLDDLQKVYDLVKERLKAKNSELASLAGEQRLEQSHASTAEYERQLADGRRDTFESDRSTEIRAGLAEIAIFASAPIRNASDIDADAKRLDDIEVDIVKKLTGLDGLDGIIQAWAVQCATKASEIQQLQARVVQLRAVPVSASQATQQAVWAAKSDLSRLTTQLGQAKAARASVGSKIGCPCGECGKIYTNDDLGHIATHANQVVIDVEGKIAALNADLQILDATALNEIQAGLDQIGSTIVALESDISRATIEASALNAKSAGFDQLKSMRASLTEQRQSIPTSRATLAAQRHAREKIDASKAALRAQIEAAQARPNPFADDISRWEQRKTQHAARVKEIDEASAAINLDVRKLKVLEEAYGRTGLKAHILETVTPILNTMANDYAMRLADGAVKIEFSTITKLRDGSIAERFSVNVANDQGADGYLGNSSGEQRKIDLAIALAMSDLVAARSSKAIDIWCADEIAESLDATAVDRVVDVLKEKAKARGTVVVISHTPMSDLIPQIVTMRKTAGGSQLIDGAVSGW